MWTDLSSPILSEISLHGHIPTKLVPLLPKVLSSADGVQQGADGGGRGKELRREQDPSQPPFSGQNHYSPGRRRATQTPSRPMGQSWGRDRNRKCHIPWLRK